ncbi:MAG: peptide deformylase [Chlamydiales bacterium]|nr:peptide deformylase [Chlamydiales bacterium]
MRLPLIYYGNPLLRVRSEPIEEITPEIRQLAMDMIETADLSHGIGLSAVQIGRPIRLFVCRSYIVTPEGQWNMTAPQVYINPKLSKHSEEQVEDDEGCLSIPKLRGKVFRPERLTIEALDINGQTFVEELEGYNARIRMHENDHLNGVLYIDRMEPASRKKLEPLLREIKKKYN